MRFPDMVGCFLREEAVFDVPMCDATPESTRDYGIFIGEDVLQAGLGIPFYAGSVEEGQNLDFRYHGQAVVRTARISHRDPHLTWFERHLRMTQIFLGLGSVPFVMVLARPNHEEGRDLPDFETLTAFRMPPGTGIMIHAGTWHDFPMAIDRPVTVFTANSAEVVEALCAVDGPQEIDQGDVYKINIPERTGVTPRVPF